MDVSKYTDEELYRELDNSQREWQYWENRDKRYKIVKYHLMWARNLTLRDRDELRRRGLPIHY